MKTLLGSCLTYRAVHKLSAVWSDTPTGLGHYDIAFYISEARRLEGEAQRGKKPYWVLDLGTYFGHSAISTAYGASKVSRNPLINILSIDIFEQPQWLLQNNPDAVKFVNNYGSADCESVDRRLKLACDEIGLTRNPIRLLKKDVLTLTKRELGEVAPEGYKLILVDCGKTPDLINKIAEFIIDSQICPTGTVVGFQDFFDWHAPWNVYAFWKLWRAGVISLHLAGSKVIPFAEKKAEREVETICDRIEVSHLTDETWCTSFTSLENETEALDHFIALFHEYECVKFEWSLRCLKVGALLRAGMLDAAEALIVHLDGKWPTKLVDHGLQNAYCRLMHLRTGRKDLSLTFDSPAYRSRHSHSPSALRRFTSRLNYLLPVDSQTLEFPSSWYRAGGWQQSERARR